MVVCAHFLPGVSTIHKKGTDRRTYSLNSLKREEIVRLNDNLICFQTSSVNSSTYRIDWPGCHKGEGTAAPCHLTMKIKAHLEWVSTGGGGE